MRDVGAKHRLNALPRNRLPSHRLVSDTEPPRER
jgi:hypothetical protein